MFERELERTLTRTNTYEITIFKTVFEDIAWCQSIYEKFRWMPVELPRHITSRNQNDRMCT